MTAQRQAKNDRAAEAHALRRRRDNLIRHLIRFPDDHTARAAFVETQRKLGVGTHRHQ